MSKEKAPDVEPVKKKIRFKGNVGNYVAGEIYEVDEAEAVKWLSLGYAEEV